MYTVTYNHGAKAMRYQRYLCDTVDDVLSLPTAADQVAIGSEATCLEDSTIYILNNARHWVPFRVLADGYTGVGGLTAEIKEALLDLLEHVAYIDDDGQEYYDVLEEALYPPADLVSISAVFSQGQAVIYDTDSLDTLRQYLTVTATYSDSTTETVTTYTLSGTLTEGTSTITVSYGGKTTTFAVTVTAQHYICNLTGSDFMYQTRLTDSSPYYGASQSNYHRTSYVDFDIPVNAGKIKFTLNTTATSVKFGIQCISATGYSSVQNSQSIATDNKFDPGYMHSGDTATIPATFSDGSAPAYMRITLTDENGRNAIPLADIISFTAEETE